MKSISEVFGVWHTLTEMATEVGESHWTVRKWKQRKRIPAPAWTAVIEAARRKGKDLSANDLLSMHKRRTPVEAAGVNSL